MILLISIFLFVAIVFIVPLIIFSAPQFGAKTTGWRLDKIKKSNNFSKGRFVNLLPTPMAAENTKMWKNGIKFLKKGQNRTPSAEIETLKFDKQSFIQKTEGIRFAWFGHSSLILNINDIVILTDPVFSEKASPFSIMGVKRFDYSNQFAVEDLPAIDVILISHDHYDHLDYKTIRQVDHKVQKYIVPLGVAAHLMRWGVNEKKITELDWWETFTFENRISFISTPARHFSGRKFVDKDKTLWSSWSIFTNEKRIFYCGDSGYSPHFKEIGEKLGPFDLTFMECGQYNEGWPYIHMMPEQSVQAHIDLKGKIMMPIHWGKFNLSLHSWTEPVDRAIVSAKRHNVDLITPKPGEIINLQVYSDNNVIPQREVQFEK
ncbi:MAG: MBL fold metallo-hydrolase [Bacteroidales bacterium]